MSSNIGGSEKSQLWVVISGSQKTGCDVWQLECQASNVTASVQSDQLLHEHMLPVFFTTDRLHRRPAPRSDKIQPIRYNTLRDVILTCAQKLTRVS